MHSRKGRASYDLWEANDGKTTKNAKESTNNVKRVPYTPSILSSVQVPPEGTSYNPPADSYLDYIDDVAKEEARRLAKEVRENMAMKLVSSSKLRTEHFRNEFHVFNEALHTKNELDDSLWKKEETEEADEEKSDVEKSKPKRNQPKAKTLKQKRDARIRKLKNGRNKDDLNKKMSQQLQNLKSITKKVRREVVSHQVKVANRQKERTLKRLTGKRRLGRGFFEEFVEPVLLPREVGRPLRCTHQQSDVLIERMNSYQRRNVLPTAGDRIKSDKKMSLRVKVVEKRAVKKITKDSKVI